MLFLWLWWVNDGDIEDNNMGNSKRIKIGHSIRNRTRASHLNSVVIPLVIVVLLSGCGSHGGVFYHR